MDTAAEKSGADKKENGTIYRDVNLNEKTVRILGYEENRHCGNNVWLENNVRGGSNLSNIYKLCVHSKSQAYLSISFMAC
ncbi:hypothetical protein ACH3XW_42965 [Acanthocheilonema viteae]